MALYEIYLIVIISRRFGKRIVGELHDAAYCESMAHMPSVPSDEGRAGYSAPCPYGTYAFSCPGVPPPADGFRLHPRPGPYSNPLYGGVGLG